MTETRQKFRAVRGKRVVARATSLRELSAELERHGIDPKKVLITSSVPLKQLVKLR